MKHILVVDDDMMNLMLVKHALKGLYEITGVTSGEEALKALERSRFDTSGYRDAGNGWTGSSSQNKG